MHDFLQRYSPPGQNITRGLYSFYAGLAAAFLFSLSFFLRYSAACQELFLWNGAEKMLKPGAVIPPFREILGPSLLGFLLLAFCMLSLLFYHRHYFYQDSKSVYLMKRLPEKGEMAKRIGTLPVLAFLLCLAALLFVRLLYFAVYLLATPDLCLPADARQQFWRLF